LKGSTQNEQVQEKPQPMNRKCWYEIRVNAALTEPWKAWFDHIQITREANGQSKISGWMDQATIYGILTRLRDLGIALTSITSQEEQEKEGE
jgi:hypothetical protein